MIDNLEFVESGRENEEELNVDNLTLGLNTEDALAWTCLARDIKSKIVNIMNALMV